MHLEILNNAVPSTGDMIFGVSQRTAALSRKLFLIVKTVVRYLSDNAERN